MPEIQVLDPHVADLIAAGEVVERPASVAKELMENAIDAGARSVTVEIAHGGLTFLRVTDDGCGIPAPQMKTAFLRHATSKLRTEYDLEAIGTLGFRGEALAAISAVSRIDVMSRTQDAPLGASLSLEGGVAGPVEQAGCPLGTTMVVRDLFYNTPARLKFMKRDAAEGAAVFALVQKLALSRPEVALKFLRDGKQELLTPGDGKLSSALYAVLGRDLALGYTPVQGEGEDVSVTGYITLPACCRGNRTYQHFFVNGRYIKSKLLTAALERAYENQKMVGKFPGCVLQLQVKANAVDVNVHPAKTEVKFLYERKVFDGVYYAILSALNGEDRHPTMTFAPPAPPPRPAAEPPGNAAQGLRGGQVLRDAASATLLRPVAKEYTPRYTPPSPLSTGVSPKSGEESTVLGRNVDKPVENVENPPKAPAPPAGTPRRAPSPALEQVKLDVPPPRPAALPAEPLEAPEPAEVPWRLAGEVLQTYLIVEQGDEIHLIDKHAAHERMNFDRMKAADYQPMAQTLLEPVVMTPPPEEGEVLLRHRPLLAQFGFACEPFGGGALVVREIPDYLEPGQVAPTLEEIAGQLLAGVGADPQAARDALLHTMACKAAVKGGQKNSRQELLVVAQAVMAGQVKYCPHGRPVAITMTRSQLERQFKRS